MELDLLLAAGPLAVALWLRPWRLVGPAGPPWIWLAWCALMPLRWGTDRNVGMSVVQPLSGAVMLLMMTGWPLAMLALVPVTLLTWAMAGLDAAEALHRLVWLGQMPATIALLLGAAVRRWLPNQLFVYILGRGFAATALRCANCRPAM